MNQAYRDRRPLEARDVERRTPNGDIQYFDVNVGLLIDRDGSLLGASIADARTNANAAVLAHSDFFILSLN